MFATCPIHCLQDVRQATVKMEQEMAAHQAKVYSAEAYLSPHQRRLMEMEAQLRDISIDVDAIPEHSPLPSQPRVRIRINLLLCCVLLLLKSCFEMQQASTGSDEDMVLEDVVAPTALFGVIGGVEGVGTGDADPRFGRTV